MMQSMFRKQLYLVLLMFTCILVQSPGQTAIDSLKRLLPQTREDTARTRLYKSIVEALSNDPKQALYYANLGLKHVIKMHWPKGVAVFNGIFGRIYTDLGEYAKAKRYLTIELEIHQRNQDQINIANSYNSFGTLYLRQGQHTQALNEYLQALKVAESAAVNALIPNVLENISVVYFDQEHYDKAFHYSKQALKKYQMLGDTMGMAKSLSGMANNYHLTKDTIKAIQYYQKALDLYQQIEAPVKMAEVYQNQALLIKQLPNKLQLQLKAQAIWDQTFPAHQLSIVNLGNIGWSFLESAKQNPRTQKAALDKATFYYQRAIGLADSAQDLGNQHLLLGLHAELEAAKGNYKIAYQAMYQYHELYDSIYSQETKNKLAEAESNYFIDQKNTEIAIQRLTIGNQRKIQWAFGLGSLFLLVIAFLFYRLSQNRRKSNQQLQQLNLSLDQANRQKAQLLAVLSHDLRHPLSNLIALLHLQKNAPDLLTPELAQQNQANITANTEILLENLENMLLWSKEQMNQAGIEKQTVLVKDLFQRLHATFAVQNQFELVFDCPTGFSIHTDPNYLWIILQNLSSNSSKALQKVQNGKITWRAWNQDAKNYLSIEDNGAGFPVAVLQGFNQTKNEMMLSGFGLQVVQDFAQKLDIDLHFENSPSGGARVLLIL
ncbi:tetratricopeptide repeat-containing sensor histidine kinase [Haliscomenobacter sp.]|uniref:ATP-binding protein n=1 Tax=Haliscomenobacter sp. TaxID=2717303 RepID=UPI003364ED15